MEGSTAVRIFNSALAIPTSLTATVGNLLVLVSIWRTPSLHEPTMILLCNLALSDFCVGLVVQPIFVVLNISMIQNSHRVFEASRIALHATGRCMSGVSLFTLTAIGLDRFIAIRYHLRYKEIVTTKRVVSYLVLVWFGVVITAAILLVWEENKLAVYFRFAAFFMCLPITTAAYCWIYQVVRRHQKLIKAQKPAEVHQSGNSANFPQLKKSAWSMLLIYLVFVCIYLVYFIPHIVITSTGRSAVKQAVYEMACAFVFINSTLNPILYCWRIEGIRAAVVKTVRKICFTTTSRDAGSHY